MHTIIVYLLNKCRRYGVGQVIIFSIICGEKKFLNENIQKITFSLNLLLNENRFTYLDNININKLDLREDALHLLEHEKLKLASNFKYFKQSMTTIAVR